MSNTTVSLHACKTYHYPDIKQAVSTIGEDLFGGWDKCIPRGARVLLKPNLLKPATAEQAVSPHPAVVRAVAEMCLDFGAGKVIIGDSPGMASAEKVCAKCGIMDVAGELGIDLVNFTESVDITTPEKFLHKKFTIAREAAEADIIINLPKFKTHAMMVLTLAVKNLYGLFVGKQKARWHFQSGRDYDHFARLLMELAYTVNPAVSILDAIVGMEGNGPGNGTPRTMGFLAASRDMVSLDLVAAEIAGLGFDDIYTLRMAREMGFSTELSDIPVVGDAIGPLRIHDLEPAASMQVQGPLFIRLFSGLVEHYLTTQPRVDSQLCKGCGICLQACPAASIRQPGPNLPVTIRHAACIRCFCCQELCPEGAIIAKDAIGVKLLKALNLE